MRAAVTPDMRWRWPSKFTDEEVAEELIALTSHNRPEVVARRKLNIAAWLAKKEEKEFRRFCDRLRNLIKWRRWRAANPEIWRDINRLAQAKRARRNVARVREMRQRNAKRRPPLSCEICGVRWCNIPRQGHGPTRFCSRACKREGERRSRTDEGKAAA